MNSTDSIGLSLNGFEISTFANIEPRMYAYYDAAFMAADTSAVESIEMALGSPKTEVRFRSPDGNQVLFRTGFTTAGTCNGTSFESLDIRRCQDCLEITGISQGKKIFTHCVTSLIASNAYIPHLEKTVVAATIKSVPPVAIRCRLYDN